MTPRDLQFSEVTSRSFRTTWVSDSADVSSFLVRFRPAADTTGDYISLVVPGDTTTAILPYLIPLTTYEVNVIAQYDKGDSFPLTGEETTLEGKSQHLISHEPQSEEGIYVGFCIGWFWDSALIKVGNPLWTLFNKSHIYFRTRNCPRSQGDRGDNQ